jgi:hypothetical protein
MLKGDGFEDFETFKLNVTCQLRNPQKRAEGAYLKVDWSIVKVSSVLLVSQHQSGYFSVRPDYLPTSVLWTLLKTARNVHNMLQAV